MTTQYLTSIPDMITQYAARNGWTLNQNLKHREKVIAWLLVHPCVDQSNRMHNTRWASHDAGRVTAELFPFRFAVFSTDSYPFAVIE